MSFRCKYCLKICFFLLFCSSLCSCIDKVKPVHVPTNPENNSQSVDSSNQEISPTYIPSPQYSNESVNSTETMIIAPTDTINPEQIRTQILDLVQNNGGCKLPCWWGITPERTSWEDAITLLKPLAFDVYTRSQKGSIYAADVYFHPVPELSSTYISSEFRIKDGIVQTILVHDFELSRTYQVANFLDNYGSPSEIWINTFSEDFDDRPPFSVAMFYPDDGMLVTYYTQGEILGSTIRACFQMSPTLRLWNPNSAITFYEATEMFHWDVENAPFFPLTDVTEIDVEQLYELFRDPSSQPCLETPITFWSPP
jgi:hypothetical protein